MALGLGFVGTGKIADKHAIAVSMTDKVTLQAVASRKLETAKAFADRHGGDPVEGWQTLLTRDDVDAVYIATPTGAKHEIAMAALQAGKHVLVEKPLASAASAQELDALARQRGLTLMDATHMTHNPRTTLIAEEIRTGVIGKPLSLVASFHVDIADAANIRFDTNAEPYGALGDLGWYCVRLVPQLVPTTGAVSAVGASGTYRDGALVSASAAVTFESGQRLVMDCGFDAGAFCQDMMLIGTEGILSMDDFVHDWEKARIGEEKPEFSSGYRLRSGRTDPSTVEFRATPAEKSHMISLLEDFADLARSSNSVSDDFRQFTIPTQAILDKVWEALRQDAE